MILADTSVWVDHMRSGDEEMRRRLGMGQIVIHPLITSELALGSLKKRTKVLALLDRLPQARVAQLKEVRELIEARHLYGRGIGLIDAHLLAAVFINPSTVLWTRDKQLRKVAEALGVHAGLA